MRVLFIHTYYYPENMGGAEISVQKLAEELVRQGHDIHVLCTADYDKYECINGVKIWRFKPYTTMRYINYAKRSFVDKVLTRWQVYVERILDVYNPWNYKLIKKYISDIMPDIVHVNCTYHMGVDVWKAAYDCGVPVVDTIRDFYYMCHNVNLRHTFSGKNCTTPNFICKLRRRKIMEYMKKYVTCVTTPSKTMARILDNQYFLKYNDIKIVYNAIDYDADEVDSLCSHRIEMIHNKKDIHFVYLGTLGEYKGIKWLIESFQLAGIDNACLHIAGRGKLLSYVLEKAESDRHIIYEGFLQQEDVKKLLTSCDVLICPSIWPEPFGRVVLDAYAHGLPVIVSNSGALPELVINGKTGMVVETDNQNQLIKAMNYMMNPSIMQSMIKMLPRQISKFGIEQQAQKFINIYTQSYSG